MRRMLLSEEALEEMGLKYTTGEFEGTGSGNVTIKHGLGEVPFLFAFTTDMAGEEEAGTTSGMFMNTALTTRYTSTTSKQWSEVGNIIATDEVNTVQNVTPSSTAYGVASVDENEIVIRQYGNAQIFISGKIYKWIAVADWR